MARPPPVPAWSTSLGDGARLLDVRAGRRGGGRQGQRRCRDCRRDSRWEA